MIRKGFIYLSLFSAVNLFISSQASSQSATPTVTPAAGAVLTTEGISGDIDKKNREPVLSVRVAAGTTSAVIYADAYVINGEFTKYPIQFDFYVNRSLFASQIRSTELPGPVGVTVPYETAPLPFNYTVVAKVLHPNRTFTTVLNATVERADPTPAPATEYRMNCTLTESATEETEETTYTATDVLVTESGSELSTYFEAKDTQDETVTVDVGFRGTEDSSSLSGTMSVDVEDSAAFTGYPSTGTYVKTGGSLISFAASVEDPAYSLRCASE